MAELNKVERAFIMLFATDKFEIYQTQNKPDYRVGLFFCPIKCHFQKKLSTTFVFASIPCHALFSASFAVFLSSPLLIGFSDDF